MAYKTVFNTVLVTSRDFERAAALAAKPELWLRAGDALNLAIAEREAFILCTLDKRLLTAAEQTGLKGLMP